MINVIATADKETLFLARNPGEFQTTLEKEKSLIEKVLKNPDMEWFVAEYEGRVVGQCSVGLVKSLQRYRHRAEVVGTMPKALKYLDDTFADEYKMVKYL